MIKQQTNQPIC